MAKSKIRTLNELIKDEGTQESAARYLEETLYNVHRWVNNKCSPSRASRKLAMLKGVKLPD